MKKWVVLGFLLLVATLACAEYLNYDMHNVRGDGGTISGFTFGASGYTDDARFNSVITTDPWVDVRAYGAVCDGTTDDAAGIQAAFDAATSGDIVLIPGVCAVGSASWTGLSISTKSNIRILGLSKKAGLKALVAPSQAFPSGSYKPILLIADSSHIQISGLTINGNGIDAYGIGLDNCSYSTVNNNYFYGFTTDAENSGIMSLGGTYNRYLNNTVANIGRGIWIGNSTSADVVEKYALIQGNTIINNNASGIGGTLQYSRIIGNYVDNNQGSGIAIGSDDSGSYRDVSIQGNTIFNNLFHGIQSDAWSSVASDCTVTSPFNIVITGNDVAYNKNDGIYVVYAENWVISGNNIYSNNYDGTGSGYGIQLLLWAKDITISGNNIYDDDATPTQIAGVLISPYDTALGIERVSVNSNNIYNNDSYGIWITRNTTGTATDVIVSNNVIINNNTTSDSYGIVLSAGWDNVALMGNIARGHTYDISSDLDHAVYGVNNITSGTEYGHVGTSIWGGYVGYAAAAPDSGTWKVGDFFFNTGADNVIGWKCTVAGTPGTWKYMQGTQEP